MYSLARSSRAFATAAPKTAVSTAQYNVVNFVKEDPSDVCSEVPYFSFYHLPEEPGQNPFKLSPMSEQIIEVPNVDLPKPELKYSKLENGLKIVSCDRGGLASSLGLFVHAGSRFEKRENPGVAQMLEMVAYRSTAHLSHLRTVKTFETLGVEASARAGRESINYYANCLREYMPIVAPLLVGNILYPRLLRWEVASAHRKIQMFENQLEDDTDELLNEYLHQAAFHNNTLGTPLPVAETSLPHFEEHTLRQYIVDHFAPERMTFVGVNVEHDEFCKWLMRSFCDYNSVPMKAREEPKAEYTGGYRYVSANDKMCHVGVGFHHPGGWNSDDAIALSVYTTLLGGTIGGVENVTQTKLSKTVLSNPKVSCAMAFNNQYSDAGLFGVHAAMEPTAVAEYLNDLHGAMASPVTAAELSMAKNQLKRLAHEGSGNMSDMVEDIGRQVTMSGHVLTAEQVSAKIDAVTESHIKAVQALFTKSKPSVVAYGNIAYVPHYDSFVNTFASATPKTAPAKKK